MERERLLRSKRDGRNQYTRFEWIIRGGHYSINYILVEKMKPYPYRCDQCGRPAFVSEVGAEKRQLCYWCYTGKECPEGEVYRKKAK